MNDMWRYIVYGAIIQHKDYVLFIEHILIAIDFIKFVDNLNFIMVHREVFAFFDRKRTIGAVCNFIKLVLCRNEMVDSNV